MLTSSFACVKDGVLLFRSKHMHRTCTALCTAHAPHMHRTCAAPAPHMHMHRTSTCTGTCTCTCTAQAPHMHRTCTCTRTAHYEAAACYTQGRWPPLSACPGSVLGGRQLRRASSDTHTCTHTEACLMMPMWHRTETCLGGGIMPNPYNIMNCVLMRVQDYKT